MLTETGMDRTPLDTGKGCACYPQAAAGAGDNAVWPAARQRPGPHSPRGGALRPLMHPCLEVKSVAPREAPFAISPG